MFQSGFTRPAPAVPAGAGEPPPASALRPVLGYAFTRRNSHRIPTSVGAASPSRSAQGDRAL